MTEENKKLYSANMPEQRKRLIWLDIAKSIAMLLAIFGHTCPSGILKKFIYSFHMPLFFFLSGYTFKPLPDENWKRSFVKSTLRDARRLMIPFLLIRIFKLFIDMISGEDIIRSITIELNITIFKVDSSGYVWFLCTLFWAKLFYRLIFRFVKKYRSLIICFISFIGMGIGSMIGLSQNIDVALATLLFIEAGYTLKQYEISGRQLSEKIMAGAFLLWTYLVSTRDMFLDLRSRCYHGGVECIIAAIAGCIVFIGLSRYSETLYEKSRLVRLMSFIGRNTLYLLCIHNIELYLIDWPATGFVLPFVRIFLDVTVLLAWTGILHGIKMLKNIVSKRKSA